MERLKQLRSERKITQLEMAQMLGVDRSTYVKYERGNSEPPNSTLCKLADFFNVSVDDLLGRSSDHPADTAGEQKETPTPISEDERNIVRMAGRDGSYVVRRLSDEQYAAVKALLDQLPDADF